MEEMFRPLRSPQIDTHYNLWKEKRTRTLCR